MTIVRRLFTFMGMKVDKAGFDKADKRTDSLKTGIGKIGGAADSIRGKVLGMIGAFAGLSAFKGLINTNIEAQKLGAQLKSVTGSAEKGAAAFNEIKKFAATTPFELNNVTKAFIKLKAAGIEPTNDVMKAVGNLAAANATTIAQAASAITKANKGLTEELGSQLNIVSKTTAKTITLTVQGAETTIKRSGTNISDFLLDIGRTKFATGMSDQMQTIGGKLSNLSDATTNFKVLIGEAGLNDAVFKLVDQFIRWISVNDKLAEQIGKKLGVAIDKLGESMNTVKDNSGKAQIATGAFVGAMAIPKVVAFGASTKLAALGIAGGLAAIKLKLVQIGAVLARITPAMVGIAIVVALVIDLISFFAGGPSVIGKFVETFKDGEGGLAGMARALLQMKDAVLKIVNDVVSLLAPIISQIAETLGSLVSSLLDAVGSILAPAVELISIIVQLVLVVVGIVLQLASVLIGIVVGILNPIVKVVVFLFRIVGFIFKIVAKIISAVLKPVLDFLKLVSEAIAFTVNEMVNLFTDGFDRIGDLAAEIFKPITDGFSRFVEGVKEIIRDLPASMVPSDILAWAGVMKPLTIDTGRAVSLAQASSQAASLMAQLASAPDLSTIASEFNVGSIQVNITTDSTDPEAVGDKSREGLTQALTDFSSLAAEISAAQ